MKIYGLPGIYQNWTIATVNKNGYYQDLAEISFRAYDEETALIPKDVNIELMEQDPEKNICIYVSEENMPWSLYNFFERSMIQPVMVDNLPVDLFAKGGKTCSAFKIHIIEKYGTRIIDSMDHRINSLTEAFYHFFRDNSDLNCWKRSLSYQSKSPNSLNLEYSDFADRDVLLAKFTSFIPDFDVEHFDKMHKQLALNNTKYFDSKKNFFEKLHKHDFLNMSIIEMGYVGYIVDKALNQGALDWYNPLQREKLIQQYVDL